MITLNIEVKTRRSLNSFDVNYIIKLSRQINIKKEQQQLMLHRQQQKQLKQNTIDWTMK